MDGLVLLAKIIWLLLAIGVGFVGLCFMILTIFTMITAGVDKLFGGFNRDV